MDAGKPGTLAEVGAPEGISGEAPEVTALVDRAKTGDQEAFADLMRLYERRIIAIGIQMGLSRDDALDASQDAFIKVFRYIRRFRSGRSFFKWLHRIAIHAVYDHLRRRRRPGVVSLEEAGDALVEGIRDSSAGQDRLVEAQDLRRKLVDSLDLLSRQERIVFVLRDLQQVSTEDIGRIMRLSRVTVRRHCVMARQKLRQRLFPRNH